MDERQRRHTKLEAALREVITQVLLIVNEKKDHIPPVLQPDVVISFPYEISIPRYKMVLDVFIISERLLFNNCDQRASSLT